LKKINVNGQLARQIAFEQPAVIGGRELFNLLNPAGNRIFEHLYQTQGRVFLTSAQDPAIVAARPLVADADLLSLKSR
jgi:hypothetical protein